MLTTVLSLFLLQLAYRSGFTAGVCARSHELERVTRTACLCVYISQECMDCIWMHHPCKQNSNKLTSSPLRTQTLSSHHPEGEKSEDEDIPVQYIAFTKDASHKRPFRRSQFHSKQLGWLSLCEEWRKRSVSGEMGFTIQETSICLFGDGSVRELVPDREKGNTKQRACVVWLNRQRKHRIPIAWVNPRTTNCKKLSSSPIGWLLIS